MTYLKGVAPLILAILSVAAAQETVADRAKYGRLVGNITTKQFGVKGKVYAVNKSKLFIKEFSYNGDNNGATEAFFQIKNKGPSTDFKEIPYPASSSGHLGKYANKDIELDLPNGQNVSSIETLFVRSRTKKADEGVYGSLTFDSGIPIPKPQEIEKFTELQHKLKSGKVIIKDAKTLFIPKFHYDGEAPKAYFFVGTGRGFNARKNPKSKVNFEKEGDQRIARKYEDEDITITLPGDLNVYNIEWLSVWCVQFNQEFGHVDIPKPGDLNVPPFIEKKLEDQEDTGKIATLGPSDPEDTTISATDPTSGTAKPPKSNKDNTSSSKSGATFMHLNFILCTMTISTSVFCI